MKPKSILREFSRYCFMNVIGMIGLSCYILADTFFVSKGLGTDGLAALNIAIPVYSFIHGSGLMLGIGGAARFSILKSQSDSKGVNKVFMNTLYLGALIALMIVAFGLFASGNIAGMLGAKGTVHHMTKTYLNVLMLFAPAFLLNDIMICFVRNDGNPTLSMTAMLAGSFANIVLDYVFIFPMGMGIFGAVFATGLAPVVSLCLLSTHFLKKKNGFSIEKSKIHGKFIGSMIGIGLPSLISEVASGVVIIVFNIIILELKGVIGVAAYGVIANIALVAVAVYTGIAQGMQPLISREYGCGNRNTTQRCYRYAMITMLGISIFIYALIFGLSEDIVKIFNSEQNMKMQEIAAAGLKIYFLAIPFIGTNIITAMFFSSVEKITEGQVISVLRGFLLTIPMAFFLSHIGGLFGVWITVPVTEGIVSLIAYCFWIKYKKSWSDRAYV